MSNDKFVKTGRDMWLELFEALMAVAQLEGAKTPEEMAAVWGGYLAAAAGSGCGVFGKENMEVIIRSVLHTIEPEFSWAKPYDLNREQN